MKLGLRLEIVQVSVVACDVNLKNVYLKSVAIGNLFWKNLHSDDRIKF